MKRLSLLFGRSLPLGFVLKRTVLLHLQLLEQAMNLILHVVYLVQVLLVLERVLVVLDLEHADFLVGVPELLEYSFLLLVFLEQFLLLRDRLGRMVVALHVFRLVLPLTADRWFRLRPAMLIRSVQLFPLGFKLLLLRTLHVILTTLFTHLLIAFEFVLLVGGWLNEAKVFS